MSLEGTGTKTVRVYWNNICVLNKQELVLLEKASANLLAQGIRISVSQFGFGYPEHMSDRLRQPGSLLPDVFVSADLEVYEDSRIFGRFKDHLYPVRTWAELPADSRLAVLDRGPCLLPYVVIPLVLYTKNPAAYQGKTLAQIVDEGLPLLFGGVNNSAGKSVTKLVWDRCGKEAARTLLERTVVGDIPVAAFQMAKRDPAAAALVPTVYACTADGQESFAICPADGACAVPSYIAVRRSIPEDIGRAIVAELTAPDFCRMFVARGRLIAASADSPQDEWVSRNCRALQLPSASFFEQVNPEEFYGLYSACVPGVKPIAATTAP